MDEMGTQMELELALEQVVEAKQYLVDLDRRSNQLREAQRRLKTDPRLTEENPWILCSGSTFVSSDLNYGETRRYFEWQQRHVKEEIELARASLKEKVLTLAQLEGPDSALAHLNEGFELRGLDTKPTDE